MTRPLVRPEKPRSTARRSFLRAVGTAATALPFYQLLEDSFAHAAGETLPLKFLTVSHPHGIAREYLGARAATSPDIAEVARLLQKLDEHGAFDSTLVYVTSELGNPNLHSSASVPTVLAGGANVPFRFGRRVQLTPDCAPPNDSCKPRDAKFASGASNHLLVSIAQAMGADTDSFGTGPDSTFTTGPLSGLT